MSPSFAEILQSDYFVFSVGDKKRPIVVHSAAIATTSTHFHGIINGKNMTFQDPPHVDISVEDFTRFCEYAYRGDYTVPPCTIDIPDPEPPEPEPEREVVEEIPQDMEHNIAEWGINYVSKKKKKKGTTSSAWPQEIEPPPSKLHKSDLQSEFNSRNYLVDGDPRTEVSLGFNPISNSLEEENFTSVFLAHARLYSFSLPRGVDPLKQLALHKLQQTLMVFTLYENRVGDVIELARYAYSNEHTPDKKDTGELNDLRRLVVEYIASEIDIIGESTKFVELLEEGGEFTRDFWGIARTYLVG